MLLFPFCITTADISGTHRKLPPTRLCREICGTGCKDREKLLGEAEASRPGSGSQQLSAWWEAICFFLPWNSLLPAQHLTLILDTVAECDRVV